MERCVRGGQYKLIMALPRTLRPRRCVCNRRRIFVYITDTLSDRPTDLPICFTPFSLPLLGVVPISFLVCCWKRKERGKKSFFSGIICFEEAGFYLGFVCVCFHFKIKVWGPVTLQFFVLKADYRYVLLRLEKMITVIFMSATFGAMKRGCVWIFYSFRLLYWCIWVIKFSTLFITDRKIMLFLVKVVSGAPFMCSSY